MFTQFSAMEQNTKYNTTKNTEKRKELKLGEKKT